MIYLLIATNNPGKLREFSALLAGLPFQLVTPGSLGLDLEVAEDGSTYAENAAKKAKAFAAAAGLATLADDSGLEVDALGGEPGIRSARYAPGPDRTDADRRRYLLSRLAAWPRPWTAHFHCTLALAQPGQPLQFAMGECYGEIIPEERGQNGFGYDPIFFIPELGCCMAELSDEAKNQVSHRGRAVQACLPILAKL